MRNRIIHRALNGKTPNEAWTGRIPVLSHVKIFGSRAFVHIPKQKRSKLEPTADKGYLVGYAQKTKGYRVWLPKKRIIVETIHVSFHEGLFRNGEADSELGPVYKESDFQQDEPDSDSEEETTETQEKSIEKPPLTWSREVKKRKDGSRTEIFYYPSNHPRERMRSMNDIVKYSKRENIEVNYDQFDFKTKIKQPSSSRPEIEKKEVRQEEEYIEDDDYDSCNEEA